MSKLSVDRRHLVAVYGSLLSDMHNHHYLKGSRFIGDFYISGSLYSLGSFPGLKLSPHNDQMEYRNRVVAELYEVNDDTLAALDRLEGHPTFYERKIIGYYLESVPIYTYEWKGNEKKCHVVQSGDWKTHYNEREKDR